MNPIETLMTEHRLIERMLDALEAWADGMASGDADERTELGRFVTFIQEFVDPVHHGKEEDILFAVMLEHGFSREQGPVAVMLHEHVECRDLIQILATFSRVANVWREDERRQIVRAAHGYADILRHHIAKEDQILYPMSQARLSEAAKTEIADGFARFEAGKMNLSERARLVGLADALVARHLPRRSARMSM